MSDENLRPEDQPILSQIYIQVNGLTHQVDHLSQRVSMLHDEIYGNAFRPGLVSKIVEMGNRLEELTERQQRLESIIYKNYQATFGVGLVLLVMSILQFIFSLGR